MHKVEQNMYNVTELANMLLQNACYACERSDADAGRPEPIKAETVDRRRTAAEIVREQIAGCSGGAEAETIYEATLAEVAEDLALGGLQVRHMRWRLALPLENLATKLNAMIYRNLEMHLVIGTMELKEVVSEQFDIELADADLASCKGLTDRINAEMGNDPEEQLRLSEVLEELFDRFALDFSEKELAALDRKRSMDRLFALLNEKREKRRLNDGLVQYGRMPGVRERNNDREMFERLGGINNAARGLAVKHTGDLFDVTADRPGGFTERYGIIDRVPESERTGPLQGARAPVRVYRRTDRSLSMDDFSSPFAMMDAELGLYQKSGDAEYFDYRDVEEMLEDGWTLD